MWQIASSSALYRAQEWYCVRCKAVTPTKYNPFWQNEYTLANHGNGTPPPWFVRCTVCNYTHFPNVYTCPTCGWVPPEPNEWVNGVAAGFVCATPPRPIAQYQLGGARMGLRVVRWRETWLCPHCQKEFTFENGV